MALKDRQAARKAALSPADREMQAHLEAARRELDKAKAVCGRICRSTDPEEQAMAGRARQNRALLEGTLHQLAKVTSLKDALSTDIDMLPEESQAELSREASLKRRAERNSRTRRKQVEAQVQNVLHSLRQAPRGADR